MYKFFLFFCLVLSCQLLMTSCGTTSRVPSTKPEVNHSEPLVVHTAKEYVGSRYRYGATGPKQFDCSGFVYYVHSKHNKNIGRTTTAQSKSGQRIRVQQAEPGDLLFFGKGSKMQHVGIVVVNDGRRLQMIHASTSRGVIIEDVNASAYWSGRLRFAVRPRS